MKIITRTLPATVLAAGLGLASQATAHDIETVTKALTPIAPGASMEVTHTCSHHRFALSGGVSSLEQVTTYGPLVVTGSYPKTTRTWAVNLTNKSGRPTGAQEVTVTLQVYCGYRH